MALTDEELKIKQAVLDELQSNAADVSTVEEVTTLDGVDSLPALKTTNGVPSVVKAPITLLQAPATAAAATAKAAADSANQAATNANNAKAAAETATASANTAAASATDAATAAKAAAAEAAKVDSATFATVKQTAESNKAILDKADKAGGPAMLDSGGLLKDSEMPSSVVKQSGGKIDGSLLPFYADDTCFFDVVDSAKVTVSNSDFTTTIDPDASSEIVLYGAGQLTYVGATNAHPLFVLVKGSSMYVGWTSYDDEANNVHIAPSSSYQYTADVWTALRPYRDRTYVSRGDKLQYLYNNTDMIVLGAALGETSGKAYPGEKGKANADAITALSTRMTTAEGKLTGAGNIYNVTALVPLTSGYYTLATAIAAVPTDNRRIGLVITYETGESAWESKQFVGTDLSTWTTSASWIDYGAKNAVKTVTFNGDKMSPDGNGNISINVDTQAVDDTLSTDSTNPVQNKVIAAKLNEVDSSTVAAMDAEVNDTTNIVKLTLKNKSGGEIASAEFSGGTGGGGTASTSATKIVVTASVDNPTIKVGGSSMLTYHYDHVNVSDSVSDGVKGTLVITLKHGTDIVLEKTLTDVSAGTTGTVQLDDYLLAGATDVYVKASAVVTVTASDGTTSTETQTRQAYTSVTAMVLTLKTSYSITDKISGYADGETASIPYTVSGAGSKNILLLIDGVQAQSQTVTKSGQTNGSFSVLMSGYSSGRHTVQLVAEIEVSSTLTIRSEAIQFDVWRAGDGVPHVSTMLVRANGTTLDATKHLTPTISVGQYEELSFDFAAWNSASALTAMQISSGDATTSLSVSRTLQTYTNRYTSKGNVTLTMVSGGTTYLINITVVTGTVDVNEASGAVVKLSASGRSNAESTPNEWTSNNVRTTFDGVDWSSSGWTGEALKLINGAKATIGYKPFAVDPGTNGLTVAIEMMVNNVADPDGVIMNCTETTAAGVSGIRITASGIALLKNSEEIVKTKFAPGLRLQLAIVMRQRTAGREIELFVNGVRSSYDQYAAEVSYVQETPQSLAFDSDACDINIYGVRIYERDLSANECFLNYVVDRPTASDIETLYNANDVMTSDGSGIDPQKLIKQGKSVMIIDGDLTAMNTANDKKTAYKMVSVDFTSCYGAAYSFHIANCPLIVQGTSSLGYAVKNYDLYGLDSILSKIISNGFGATVLTQNGQVVSDGYITWKPGARPVRVLCAKADYSDSTGTRNTGTAQLLNEAAKYCGAITPAQAANKSAYDVRTAVDGYPFDMFWKQADGTYKYIGKYNLNNEKKLSAQVYGFEGIEGYNDAATLGSNDNKCACIEFLQNKSSVGLFTESDLSTSIVVSGKSYTKFSYGLEYRYPEGAKWGDKAANDAAIQRVWDFVLACKDDGAKFKAEYKDYWDAVSLPLWYVYTDYMMAADQRVKNMMMATWDGLHWFLIPYDNDTIWGKENGAHLRYGYLIDENTWDSLNGDYAFAGHDSLLWKLVRENLQSELQAVATKFRTYLTNKVVLDKYNSIQANWCERIYNADGYYKYINPMINPSEYTVSSDGTKNVPFGLQGNEYAYRTYMIENRMALMDAKYGTSQYLSDNFQFYLATDGVKTRQMDIVTSEPYYYGYKKNNDATVLGGVKAGESGASVTMSITGAWIINDPLVFTGASRVRELDLSTMADGFVNELKLSACTRLKKLTMKTTSASCVLSGVVVNGCKTLEEINLNGVKSSGFTSIDLSDNARLISADLGGTSLTSAGFAKGAPITSMVLPASLQTLKLSYLNKLTSANLTLEGTKAITTLIVDHCDGIDWQTLRTQCTALKYLRVTGLAMEGDGTLLRNLLTMGGVDANGNVTSSSCGLAGSYKLTKYATDIAILQAHYPELTITQPEYTMLEFDDSVADDANVSNLDNMTGYKYGNQYVPNGHVSAILSDRYRCLGKITADKEMTYYPLHDSNSTYYADATNVKDCTAAKLDSSEGDVGMHEGHYWYKGVNDYLNNKHYHIYSHLTDMPSKPDKSLYDVLTLDDIKNASNYRQGYKIMAGKVDLSTSYTADSTYAVCMVDVSKRKRVRWPSVPGTSLVGSIFTDDNGVIKDTVVVDTLSSKFCDGMYLVKDVPAGATRLYFSVLISAEFDCVILTDSTKIEDIEPDWVEHEECWIGVFESSIVNSKLRSCISGNSSVGSLTWTDFNYYSSKRKMQQIDYEMHKMIANLFYAKYGRRNCQAQCGTGTMDYQRITGSTAVIGMKDTVNRMASASDYGAWYLNDAANGSDATYTRIVSTNCIGYEDIFGDKWEMTDKVTLPYTSSADSAKWHIIMPDGAERKVRGSAVSGLWITGVVNGKYMDIIPAGTYSGSETTYYSDQWAVSIAVSRVVYRSGNYASSNYGVSCANANYDSSGSVASVGSRLAFRGKLVKAESVAAYKAISEIA